MDVRGKIMSTPASIAGWRRLKRIIEKWLRPATGVRGEAAAARYLQKQGYRILKKNWRKGSAEVDLIALSGDGCTLVAVEVKTRICRPDTNSNQYPELRVDHAKQQRIKQAMNLLAKQIPQSQSVSIRFDIIGVDIPLDGKIQIRHHAHAYE